MLARFLSEGHFASHREALRKLHARRREALLASLDDEARGLLRCREPPEAGLRLPVSLPADLADEPLPGACLDAGIKVGRALSKCYASRHDPVRGVTLGFATTPEPHIANDFDSQLVVKTTSQRGTLQRRLMKTSDWALIRNCRSAVMLLNERQLSIPKIMLAAVKLKPGDETYAILNERIISASHQMAEELGAELHAVTVYRGEDIYFDRQKFAHACRLPRNRVHSVEGAPYQGIAEVAEQIGAGTVIVGSARQPGGSILGRTAERVIDEVTANLLVLPPAESEPGT